MKIHLGKTVGNKIIGLSCVRSIHVKGRTLTLQEYLETEKELRCKKCDQLARRFTSYIN